MQGRSTKNIASDKGQLPLAVKDGRSASMRERSGFTLIELMVVMFIIAMLSTTIVPSIASALRRNGIAANGQKVHELFNFAYMSAVTKHQSVVVNIDTRRGLCWATSSPPALPWLEEQSKETEILASIELPKGMHIKVHQGEEYGFVKETLLSWETITFESDGTAEDVMIELSTDDGDVFSIEVHGVTGESYIRKGPLQ